MSTAPTTTSSNNDRRTRRSDVDFTRFFQIVETDEAAQDETPVRQPAHLAHSAPNGPAERQAAPNPTSARSTASGPSETVDLTGPDNGQVPASGQTPPNKRQRTSAVQSTARPTTSWPGVWGTLSSIKGDLSSLAESRGTYAKRMEACTKELGKCSKLLNEGLIPALRRLEAVTAKLEEEQMAAKAALADQKRG
ncbi:uncharacterized protein PV09_08054 [Verruconis gallopava]|uniref:Uncharacterized protein n=1 Tax=Verruconis gallopava TaxID=253628 RepID=A0A0D1XDN0_9PEZI|nr:uncharacterized protein PV09_08054 [Verruconis gallopava]KIW00341.1 hypothetical protein PV09_08054 [Verruconis gallopava]